MPPSVDIGVANRPHHQSSIYNSKIIDSYKMLKIDCKCWRLILNTEENFKNIQ